MVYGRNNNRYNKDDIEEMKKKISQQMPGVNLDNINQDQMKKLVMDHINNNPNLNISQEVKDKINRGDIEGLKDELVQYLDKQNSPEGQRLSNMLKTNDFDGLKEELMGMLIKGMSQQKKNDIGDNYEERAENVNYQNPLAGLFDEALLNNIMEKFFEGNKNDRRIVLLNSIKPFVSEKRQKALDDCVKAMNIICIMEKLGFKAGR
ncbi:hypothetical protein [Lutispora sp.]|jgi:ParB-like chromosome segregation protein Spo0J|uniref:hypothetical protein n=1 Tax=Lutispora sp. TaxID=2828727 RepID=UPI00356824AC